MNTSTRAVSYVVLSLAAISSVATSQEHRALGGPAVLWSDQDVVVEVLPATDVDCAAIEAEPWLAAAARFDGNPGYVSLIAERPAELPAQVQDTTTCQVALLGADASDAVMTVPAGRQVTVYPHPSVGIQGLTEGYLALFHSSSTWFDAGAGTLQPAPRACDAIPEPSWTSVPDGLDGDVVVEAIERDGDCATLVHDRGELALCGLDLPFVVGDLVHIEASDHQLILDGFDSGHVAIGEVAERLRLDLSLVLGPDPCVSDDRCAPTLEASVAIEDHLIEAGATAALADGGEITVLKAGRTATSGCDDTARIAYWHPGPR